MLLEMELESLQQTIFDLKKENKNLRLKVDTISVFLDNSPTFISFISPNNEVKYINKKLEDFTGKKVVELNNTYLTDNIHPAYQNYLSENLSRAFETENIFDVKFQVKDKNNQYVWFHSIGYPIYGKINEFMGYICTSHDITNSENDHSKLTQLIESNKRLFSVIGHDLRNTFNSIIGFSELLHEKAQEFEVCKIKTIGGHLKNTSKKTLTLLENLLEWGQLQNTLNTFNPEVISIKKVCEEAFQSIHIPSTDNPDRIKIIMAGEIQAIADVNMLQTIFRNLLSNALKYSYNPSPITIDATTTQNYIIISVHDRGVGLDQGNISDLFKIRQQTPSTGVSGEKGTGLGLIICKEYIEKNGGEIWVNSTIGKGSEFSFSLPKSNQH